jgi:hypothetical protein
MSLKRRMQRAVELGRGGPPPSPPPPRRVYGHEIVYTPIREEWYDTLRPAARAAIPRLHGAIQDRPSAADVAELEGLVERYPHVPVFYNFLNIAYGRVGQEEKRRTLIGRCRAVLPDYLFGKIGEAEQLLYDGEYDAFAELWGGCYDLRELYPHRSQFHLSEFAGFYSLVARYHHLMGNHDEAARIWEMLLDVAPDEGATKMLDSELELETLKILIDALDPAKLVRLFDSDRRRELARNAETADQPHPPTPP